MSSLYSLTGDYLQLQEMIEDGHEGLEDTLESIEDAIEDKLEKTTMIIRNLETEIAGYKAEEERLAKRRKTAENTVKRLKQGMEDAMLASGRKKVKTKLFSFNIQKNAPSVAVLDDALIPKQFYVPVDPRLDKKGIMERLKAGENVPGVELKQSESLRIK